MGDGSGGNMNACVKVSVGVGVDGCVNGGGGECNGKVEWVLEWVFWLTDGQMDICDSRVTLATENWI